MIATSKSELKAHMLDFFRQVETTGEELIVTSHRVPVLKVTRLNEKGSVNEIFSDLRGKVVLSDALVMAPETEEWGAL